MVASHNLGGNFQMTPDNAGANSYTITLWTYTDPATAGVDRCSATIYIYDLDTGLKIDSLEDIPRANGPLMTSLPSDCALNPGIPRNGIPVLGTIKRNQYETSYNFPGPGRYVLYFYDIARSAGIINLIGSENQFFYISAELYIPPTGVLDHPPIFLNAPLYDACSGQPWTELPGGYDPDGDSLHFELLPVFEYLTNSPFSPGTNPSIASGHAFPDDPTFGPSVFKMDPITGLIAWDTATTLGRYAIHYRVTSYRNGVKMSVIDREDIIDVIDCDNQAPDFLGSGNTDVGISDTTTLSYKIWDADSADTLSVLLNNGQLGNNGPFSNSSLFTPVIEGSYFDGETGNINSFSTLPLVISNTPGFPVDTVYLNISWKPKLTNKPKSVQLDLLAHDNTSYFKMPGTTTRATFFTTTIEIGYWPTSIDEVVANSIHLYPNPASDFLHIETPDNQPLTAVRIYDLQGRLILEKMQPDPVLDISAILDGVYIVEVTIPAGRQRIKLLKN